MGWLAALSSSWVKSIAADFQAVTAADMKLVGRFTFIRFMNLRLTPVC